MMSVGRLQEKMKKIASTMMEPAARPAHLQQPHALAGGLTKSIPLKRVIGAAYDYKQPIPGMEPGLDATSFFEPTGCTFPFGTHVAVVEVDPETGVVKFLRYVRVYDCGRIINPLLVEGQLHGGIA
jgi:carbon-monoxide dehydrogenase large subunit